MKIYVITDLEGVAGVARWDQTGPGTPGYALAKRLLTEELRACVEGIHAVNAKAEIWVWDGHGPGGLDIEHFPAGAYLLNRGPIRPPYGLDESFDALFFLGQHARAGTVRANLAHTYSSRHIASYKINGWELGEFGCRAALAGAFGIPTVFVSGDDKMIAEAQALIPGIHGAQVKIGMGSQLALHLAPADARALIRKVAADATAHIGEIEPFVLPGPPYRQEVRIWGRAEGTDWLRRGFQQVDALTFVKEAQRLQDLDI